MEQKETAVMYKAAPSDSNIKKEDKKLEMWMDVNHESGSSGWSTCNLSQTLYPAVQMLYSISILSM